MKPLIAITVESRFDAEDTRSMGDMKLNWNYAAAIAAAGGNPIIITPQTDVQALAPLLDGWLIPGGLDIDARRFGQENHPEVELQDNSRFEIEAKLYHVADAEMPILGICYGCQFINVVRGGTLVQHLPDVLDGAGIHSGGTLDPVRLESDSKLAKVVGDTIVSGKSFHHQAVDALGHGLRVAARHADGTIEAVEGTDARWMFGVQWHPERTFDDLPTRRLFSSFIQAAEDFRASKLRGSVVGA